MIRKKKQEFIRFKEVSCPALNVRSNITTSSLIIKILAKGTVVEIDKNFENEVWDHIFAQPNVEGYCMKKYLEPLKQDKIAALELEPIKIRPITPTCDASEEESKDDNKEEKE